MKLLNFTPLGEYEHKQRLEGIPSINAVKVYYHTILAKASGVRRNTKYNF
jgi:hypothetical protein